MRRDLDEARRIRAEAQALKDSDNPFHADRIRQLEARDNELGAHRGTLVSSIRRYGYLLVDAAPQIDAATISGSSVRRGGRSTAQAMCLIT
jgi:hypothetical protein